MSTTIPINPVSGYPLASATLTALTRLDTDTAVTLPSPATFTYDADADQWTIDADLPAGVEVYWEADVVYLAGGTSGADGTVIGDGSSTFDLFGSRDGMELKVGDKNLLVYANLSRGNLETPSTLTAISEAIGAALEEANAVMSLEYLKWQTGPEFVEIGYSTTAEHAVLDRGADYGAIALLGNAYVKAANISEDNLPWQVGEARRIWQEFLADLASGAILKQHYSVESDTEDSGILALQEGVGPVAKLSCPLPCCQTYDPDLYDCA